MSIVFREYQERDKDALFQLCQNLAEFMKQADPLKRIRNLPGFVEQSFHETLANAKNYQGKILLAEDENAIVGFIIGVIWEQSEKNKLEIGPHRLGEILDLYVEEPYRQQRIGTKLLAAMENYFQEKGCYSMWVSIAAFNTSAHEAYKKFGFTDRELGMLKEI